MEGEEIKFLCLLIEKLEKITSYCRYNYLENDRMIISAIEKTKKFLFLSTQIQKKLFWDLVSKIEEIVEEVKNCKIKPDINLFFDLYNLYKAFKEAKESVEVEVFVNVFKIYLSQDRKSIGFLESLLDLDINDNKKIKKLISKIDQIEYKQILKKL